MHQLTQTSRVQPAKSIKGITLIEALVALFIMSIGLLGVAGLQATSISAGHTSTQRSLAVFHVSQMADRIRANRTTLALARYGATAGNNANDCSDIAGVRVAGPNQCSDIEIAEEDVFQWQAELSDVFVPTAPGVNIGAINVSQLTTPATVTITVTWRERGVTNNYQLILRI